MHQWGSRYTPGGLGRSGKVGRGARLLGSQYQSAPACDLPQAQLFRLWRVASTEWPRPRGQEAVLLALPPAQSGANAGCKEAAGSGAAALVTGSRRWPEHGPRLPAAFLVANLPIYFSSGDGRRMQRARATTARYGRDSAAAGQGARARCGQRADRAAAGQTSGKTRSRGAALLGEINGAGVRVQPWSQSATCSACDLPQAQRTQFWLVASRKGAAVPRPGSCFVDPPTRPGRRCSERAGQLCIQGGSGERAFCNGYWQPPVLGAGARAAGGLSRI